MYAIIEYQGENCLFFVIQAPTYYNSKNFKLLIGYGSTHSFLSSKCFSNLDLDQEISKKPIARLASGKEVVTCSVAENLTF